MSDRNAPCPLSGASNRSLLQQIKLPSPAATAYRMVYARLNNQPHLLTMKTTKSLPTAFRKKMIVRPSGLGRTATWPKTNEGTVVRTSKGSIFVQWHETCVEDEMQPAELNDTGRINTEVPTGIKVLECNSSVAVRRSAASSAETAGWIGVIQKAGRESRGETC